MTTFGASGRAADLYPHFGITAQAVAGAARALVNHEHRTTNDHEVILVNPAQRLHDAGQSIWLDSINRTMLTSGTLARYRDNLAVTGLTSNPTILGHAMAAGDGYDSSLRAQLAAGARDPQQLVYAVALEDL